MHKKNYTVSTLNNSILVKFNKNTMLHSYIVFDNSLAHDSMYLQALDWFDDYCKRRNEWVDASFLKPFVFPFVHNIYLLGEQISKLDVSGSKKWALFTSLSLTFTYSQKFNNFISDKTLAYIAQNQVEPDTSTRDTALLYEKFFVFPFCSVVEENHNYFFTEKEYITYCALWQQNVKNYDLHTAKNNFFELFVEIPHNGYSKNLVNMSKYYFLDYDMFTNKGLRRFIQQCEDFNICNDEYSDVILWLANNRTYDVNKTFSVLISQDSHNILSQVKYNNRLKIIYAYLYEHIGHNNFFDLLHNFDAYTKNFTHVKIGTRDFFDLYVHRQELLRIFNDDVPFELLIDLYRTSYNKENNDF